MALAALPPRVRGVCCPPAIPLDRRKAGRMAQILKALADPTRLQVMQLLYRSQAPVCICDLTGTFKLSQPTLSHHMARLKRAGLVDASRRGIWSYYRLHSRLEPQAKAFLFALLAPPPSGPGDRSLKLDL